MAGVTDGGWGRVFVQAIRRKSGLVCGFGEDVTSWMAAVALVLANSKRKRKEYNADSC